MQGHGTMRGRPFNIEMHVQMLHARLVRLDPAGDRPVPRPAAMRRLAVRSDLALRVHSLAGQDLDRFRVFAHAVCASVENCRFAIGAEDFEVEDCEDAGGCGDAD